MPRWFLPLLLCILVARPALGLELWQSWVDVARFARIAERASHQVDLFREVWAKDPLARFYGGTARDYLWFIRKQLSRCEDKACVDRVERELMERLIDAKEFVVGESDVDVVSELFEIAADFDRAHFKRIETIRPAWLRAGTPESAQDERQGGVPVEKIILGREGFQPHPVKAYRSGVEEIWRGIPTLHADPRIVDTAMYRDGENHPLLLALRYVRQVAVAYYQRYERRVPWDAEMTALLEPESVKALESILAAVNAKPESLYRFLAHGAFLKRLNRQLGRIFRSYTNPDASRWVFRRFKIDETLGWFEGRGIEPYHTVLYAHRWDPEEVAHGRSRHYNLERLRHSVASWAVKQGLELETYRGQKTLPLFHGTRSLAAYRSIVFQGILPSPSGSAGAGPYAVDRRSIAFAEAWSRGSSPTGGPLVAKVHLRADAVVLDMSLQEAYSKNLSALGAEVGADVVRYPYGSTHAYVVVNGAAIVGSEGHSIRVMPLPEAKAFFAEHVGDPALLREQLLVDPWLATKLTYLLPGYPHKAFLEHFGEFMGDPFDVALECLRRVRDDQSIDLAKREQLLERFLWRPLRQGALLRRPNTSDTSLLQELLSAVETIHGLAVFRALAASDLLAHAGTTGLLAEGLGLAKAHFGFEPRWLTQYATRLLGDDEAYRAEMQALGSAKNPLLSAAFQGLMDVVARRDGTALPPGVPVTAKAEHWLDPALGNSVELAVRWLAFRAADAPVLVQSLVAALERAEDPAFARERRASFHWNVSEGLAWGRNERQWNRNEWALFVRVAGFIARALNVWGRTREVEEHPLPELPTDLEYVETFFRQMAARRDELHWPQDRGALARMAEAWVPEDRRANCAWALVEESEDE